MRHLWFAISVLAVIAVGSVDLRTQAAPIKFTRRFVDVNATGAQTGLSWTDAYTTIQAALADPAMDGDGNDQVLVADGVYVPTTTTDRSISFELEENVDLLGGYAGSGAAVPSERDPLGHPSILSGEITSPNTNDNTLHVVHAAAGITSATLLDGFTIERGAAVGVSGNGNGDGGGIAIDGAPTLTNLTIRDNQAVSGGGISVRVTGSLNLSRSTVRDNEGGGLAIVQNAPDSTVTNSTFTGNHATRGGAMQLRSSTLLNNVTLEGNTAGQFAAIFMSSESFGETTTIRNSLIGEPLGSLGNAGGYLIDDSAISHPCPENAFCTNVSTAGVLRLGPLQDNGGSTETMLPDALSVAVDAASPTTCNSLDQRGIVRPQDSDLDGESRCDMGAVEVRAVGFTLGASSVDESGTPGVQVRGSGAINATADYAVTGGSATPGDDFTLAAGSVTLHAGATLVPLPLVLVDDALDEPDEDVVIALSGLEGADRLLVASHALVIEDNDAAPSVQFAAATSTARESRPEVLVGLALSGPGAEDIEIPYKVTGGTASPGSDFTLADGAVTIPAGTATGAIAVAIKEDFFVEPGETIVVTLTQPQNAPLGERTVHTLTIISNDIGTCEGRPATIVGTSKSNRIVGTPGVDVISGRGGADVIRGLGGNDIICGDRGNDRLFGDAGSDVLSGGQGVDTLQGGGQADVLKGSGGADQLFGGPGRDELRGERGKDRLSGGPGAGDRCDGGPQADSLIGKHGCEVTVSVP